MGLKEKQSITQNSWESNCSVPLGILMATKYLSNSYLESWVVTCALPQSLLSPSSAGPPAWSQSQDLFALHLSWKSCNCSQFGKILNSTASPPLLIPNSLCLLHGVPSCYVSKAINASDIHSLLRGSSHLPEMLVLWFSKGHVIPQSPAPASLLQPFWS